MKPAAFRATFSDLKLVKTRQVAQLIFEIPLSDFDAAYDVLGGMPNPASERWFGIAAIQIPQAVKEAMPSSEPAGLHNSDAEARHQAGAKREWKDLQPAQQSGIRCGEASFLQFLKEEYPEDFSALEGDAAAVVRFICGVNSRAKINVLQGPRVIWHQLDSEYQAWLLAEQVGA